MKVVTTVREMMGIIKKEKKIGKSIGLVPTMGFLHEGHLTLAHRARQENGLTVMSIFVNPLQFGPNEDYDRYPRDIERDQKLAEEAGVDYLFVPSVQEMYPSEPVIEMKVIDRTDVLCGKRREGHFDGVVTVVSKLFHIVQPDYAYFGLKDAQQVAVLQGMVDQFNFPVEIVAVETVREEDGLAKSSRNVYLTEAERKKAPSLYKGLVLGKQEITNGKQSLDEVIKHVSSWIEEQSGGKVDYVEVWSFPELKPVNKPEGKLILAAAVQFSKARLIDNLIFTI